MLGILGPSSTSASIILASTWPPQRLNTRINSASEIGRERLTGWPGNFSQMNRNREIKAACPESRVDVNSGGEIGKDGNLSGGQTGLPVGFQESGQGTSQPGEIDRLIPGLHRGNAVIGRIGEHEIYGTRFQLTSQVEEVPKVEGLILESCVLRHNTQKVWEKQVIKYLFKVS